MKVSVAMVTYNHERFIAQAIESVLMQETSFEYELVIGEDCSTDRTGEIVVDYQKRFPTRIRTLMRDRNVGAHQNSAQTLAACTGEYIALLEGDDYWTSPHKLQKQADFLDQHSECSMSFHPVRWFYENPDHSEQTREAHNRTWPADPKPFSTIEDLLHSMFIQTGSVMLRNGLLNEYPSFFRLLVMGDWPLFLIYADQGLIGCLDEVMSAYRKHSGGIVFDQEDDATYQQAIDMYRLVNSHFKHKYERIIRPILADYYYKLAVLNDQRGQSRAARNNIVNSVKARLLGRQRPDAASLKILARLCLPVIYRFSKRLAGT